MAIAVRQVTKRFGSFVALDNVSVAIPAGEDTLRAAHGRAGPSIARGRGARCRLELPSRRRRPRSWG